MSVTKVLKPDQLVVVLFVINQKQAEVSHVSLSLEKPSNTQATTLTGVDDLSMSGDLGGFGTVCFLGCIRSALPRLASVIQYKGSELRGLAMPTGNNREQAVI